MKPTIKYIVIFHVLILVGSNCLGQSTKTYQKNHRTYECANHLGNVTETVSDKPAFVSTGVVASTNSYSDYFPYGMQMVGRNEIGAGYRYGFSENETDDEVYGNGNIVDFSYRSYNSRLGRWLSPDPINRAQLSAYNYVSNNPLAMIDPDGRTDYYFQGKKVASDNKPNGMIAVVHNKDVKKELKKGKFPTADKIKNGAKLNGMFIIHTDVLEATVDIGKKAFSAEGQTTEFATALKEDGSGGYDRQETNKGDPVDLSDKNATEAHVTFPKGDVSIHTHPTGFDNVSFKVDPSTKEELPNGSDEEIFTDYKMNIIIGWSQFAKQIPNTSKFSQGTEMIKFYGAGVEKSDVIGGISLDWANDIMDDQKAKNKK